MKPPILLLDLPTFPKGTVGLSLPYLAGLLGDNRLVQIIDLNFEDMQAVLERAKRLKPAMVGMKVSSQNHHIAQQLSTSLRNGGLESKVVWGGEYPTLLPELCFPFADTIVKGLFDSIAADFLNDLERGNLKAIYQGNNDTVPAVSPRPQWKALESIGRYNRFMGLPLETTRGCTESCTFCMVLIMQRKHYHTRPLAAIAEDVDAIGANFINIIDYNFGVNAEHVKQVCEIIRLSKALGFMAEMTIELLDNDAVLADLASARCKMVYCGLETIDEIALKSVGKDRTNHIEHYKSIIRKAQKAGVNVASGFILGMEHSSPSSYINALGFFKEMGIMYVKLTFLTFNPGTRSQLFYRKKGQFITEDPRHYDGNHLTFLPDGVTSSITYDGTRHFIAKFYSFWAILKRAMHLPMSLKHKTTLVLFNICYREVYHTWIREDALRENWDSDALLKQTYRKGWKLACAESLLLLKWKVERALA